MHRSDALQRQVVVHHGEHTFFHLSAVPGVYDNLLAAGDVEHNSGLRIQTQLFIILNFCFGSVVNYEIRLEVFQFFLCRTNEHIGYKVSLPSNLNDETDCHTGICVRTTESIYNEQSLVGELFLCDLLNGFPCFLACRMVVVLVLVRCPPYSIFGILIHNDEFVFRRTACIDASHNIYCAQLTDLSFFVSFQTCFGLLFE